ncbi:MAG: 2-iminoacetate synthase ThiH [Terrimicrobiaceae bacterium]|nr:2-iminoacetate synthase ThiH [Terrimicrobiaceae bacterium]
MPFSSQFESSLRTDFAGRFRSLLTPAPDARLERMAAESAAVTRRFFGRTMRLFAPLYLSNECINSCAYCGFSRENAILRVTLEIDQMLAEARHLASEGFRSILLVAGEHPKFVSNGYIEECIRRLAGVAPGISLEVAPMETSAYLPLVAAGAEGLVVYQETYHRPTYAEMHAHGPKKNFDWRLDCPERAYEAGFRRIGVGALFGLWDWREEAVALAAHIDHLLKTCWKAQLTVSLPRLRPAAGAFEPRHPLGDRDFLQLICALRLTFPHVGIVMSTREPAPLRDAAARIGVTMMSAGSHTEPGGYTGQGAESLHLTVKGRQIACDGPAAAATEQFSISDDRSAAEVAQTLARLGLDPVWKDWDAAIAG